MVYQHNGLCMDHKYGDVREDGFRFRGMQRRGDKVYEQWVSPETWERRRQYGAKWKRDRLDSSPEYRAKLNAFHKVWMADSRARDPVPHMLTAARHRAKKAGVPFDLTKADIRIPDVCPVLGIPLVRSGAATDNTPELDRLVPDLGYVRDNVSVISRRANRIKNDSSPEELVKVALWLTDQLRQRQRLKRRRAPGP